MVPCPISNMIKDKMSLLDSSIVFFLYTMLVFLIGWLQSSIGGNQRKRHTFAFLHKWYITTTIAQ